MATFDYRGEMAPSNVLPAIGAGVAAGIAVAYVANLMLRRTPLPPGRRGMTVSSGPPRVPILPFDAPRP